MNEFKITFSKKRKMQQSILGKAGLLIFAFTFGVYSAAVAQNGKDIFEENCTSCHAMNSKVIGPALQDVTKRHSKDWIKSFITNSSAMIQAGDPEAIKVWEDNGKVQMTTFDGTLSNEDIDAVIAYVEEWTPPEITIVDPTKPSELPADPSQGIFINMLVFALVIPIGLFVFGLASSLYKFLNLARKEAGIEGTVLSGEITDEVIEGHSYDGIMELNNGLPPWLSALFGLTFAFAIFYLSYYFIFDGPSQDEEYQSEMAAALEKYGDMDIITVDIALVEDELKLQEAKDIFVSNCANCHKENGAGGIGPNLTDDYWKNGGSLENIFTTIREGVPGQPMVSWKSKLSDEDILNIASYIKSLRGTNPPDAKEKEGELYKDD